MLAYTDLLAVLDTLTPVPHQGQGHRAIDLDALFGFRRQPAYPSPRPLFCLGAPARGGRYTPKGGHAALYIAEDPTTALAESWQVEATKLQMPGTGGQATAPTVLIGAHYRLDAVLDVTKPDIQALLGTNAGELTAPWRHRQARGQAVPTQDLGQAAFQSKPWQAIRYPSAKSPGACLVVFTDKLVWPSFVEVIDPYRNLCERIP